MLGWLGNSKGLHFILLGATLFIVASVFFKAEPQPPQLSLQQIDVMRQGWFRRTGTYPNAEELQALADDEINQQLLHREGVRLGLHLLDPLVWQRLVRNMEFLGVTGEDSELFSQALDMDMHLSDPVVRRRLIHVLETRAMGEAGDPAEGELQARYRARGEEYRRERVSLEHVYFSTQDRPAGAARAAAETLLGGDVPCRELMAGKRLGDIYPIGGRQVPLKTQAQLARQFGESFATAAFAMTEDSCGGPMQSAFGWHLVHIRSRLSEEIPYSNVRETLREEWLREKAGVLLRQRVRQLREKHGLAVK